MTEIDQEQANEILKRLVNYLRVRYKNSRLLNPHNPEMYHLGKIETIEALDSLPFFHGDDWYNKLDILLINQEEN